MNNAPGEPNIQLINISGRIYRKSKIRNYQKNQKNSLNIHFIEGFIIFIYIFLKKELEDEESCDFFQKINIEKGNYN